MSEEEKKAIEKEFEFALDNLISGIKETTATEIVVRQQSMILLFRKLMHEIERRDYLIEKQEKVIDEMGQELINSPIRVTKGDFFKFTNKKQTKQYFYRKVENNE